MNLSNTLFLIEQEITLPSKIEESLLKASIYKILGQSKVTFQEIRPNEIYFQAGLFRLITNLNLFLAVDEGTIKIQSLDSKQIVKLSGSTFILFLVAALGALFLGVPVFKANNISLFFKIVLVIAFFSYFFFGNVFLFKFRFKRKLLKEIKIR